MAGRRLSRGEPELAWKVLDEAVEGDVGPDRGRRPKATRRGIYGEFAAWLEQIGHAELAAQAKAQIADEPAPAWGESAPDTKSWGDPED